VSTVLALRALGLGDLLTALPALRGLRAAYPEARLLLAAPPALAPLVRLAAAADELVPTDPLGAIDVRRPDLAVNLHGRGPQSHRRLLETDPKRLVAFAHREVPETAGCPGWRAEEHEVVRWCRLLRESGIPADPARLELARPRPSLGMPPAGATLIHPGAGAPARRWPADRWAAVGRAELAMGQRVAVSAGPGEEALAAAVAAGAGLGPDSTVAGGLLHLAAAVAAAGRVVCGDTGVAHLATALGTPSVILFGPSPPHLWGPPPWHPHVALWTGRRGDGNAGRPHRGLLEITAAQVVLALNSLPQRM
jgi:ADP-heptose:LPS heptosyltransferase